MLPRSASTAVAAALSILVPSVARADNPFEVSGAADGSITGASWAATAALMWARNVDPPDARCLHDACARRGDGARPHNATWDVVSYVPLSVTLGGALVPSASRWASGAGTASQVGDSTLLLAEAEGLDVLLTEVAKLAAPRYRPFLAFPSAAGDHARVLPDANASFWSGHASSAFAAAAIGSFDACRSGGPMGCVAPAVGLHALAATTALMRVLAGEHHITDVVAGAAVGTAVGGAVALVHAPHGREATTVVPVTVAAQGAMLTMFWLW